MYSVKFMLIGLIFSVGILVGNNREIIIDTIATDMGVPAWEIAYFVYIMFLVSGVVVDMIIGKRLRKNERLVHISLTILLFVMSVFLLDSIAVGSISGDAVNMLNEFYEWYLWFSMVLAVYLFNMFIR